MGGIEKIPKHCANLVILSHVVEHFFNVGKEIDGIQDLLLPGGYLYIELPGVFNLQPYSYDFLKSLQNAHNYYFTLETLEQVLSFYGWKLEQGDETIRSVFRYTGHRNDVLTNYYPKVNSSLIYFEQTRHVSQMRYFLSKKHLLQLRAHAINLFKVKNSNP